MSENNLFGKKESFFARQTVVAFQFNDENVATQLTFCYQSFKEIFYNTEKSDSLLKFQYFRWMWIKSVESICQDVFLIVVQKPHFLAENDHTEAQKKSPEELLTCSIRVLGDPRRLLNNRLADVQTHDTLRLKSHSTENMTQWVASFLIEKTTCFSNNINSDVLKLV